MNVGLWTLLPWAVVGGEKGHGQYRKKVGNDQQKSLGTTALEKARQITNAMQNQIFQAEKEHCKPAERMTLQCAVKNTKSYSPCIRKHYSFIYNYHKENPKEVSQLAFEVTHIYTVNSPLTRVTIT